MYLFLAVLGLSHGTQDLRCSVQASSLAAMRGFSWPMACGNLLPRPGSKPVAPVLEGGFLTTGTPGESGKDSF